MAGESNGIRVTISLDEKSVECLVENVVRVLGKSKSERGASEIPKPVDESAIRSNRKRPARIRVSEK